jgi:SNF2 family DNA or RNA helicase
MNNSKYKFKTKPFEHQLTALNKSWNENVYGLLMEMGTGKTKVLIDNLGILYNQGVVNSALIVAPKGVYKTWEQQEFPKHLPNYIMEHTRLVMWQPNLTQKQTLKMQTIMENTDDLKIFIMNTEAFSTEKGIKYAEKFLLVNKAMFVIDESTTIKNPQAKRTRNIIKLSNLAKYKRILTGTPVTRSPLDLYSQFYFLDPDILNFSSYYSFRSRYAMMVNRTMGSHSFNLIIGYRNLKELSKKLKPHSYRILKEKCLDLPDKIYMKRIVTLTKEQQRIYNDLKEQALAEFNSNETVTVTNALATLSKIHQVVCGHVITDMGKIEEIKSNRLKELLEILDECSGKVIIWASFRESIRQIEKAIQEKYKDKAVVATYFGDTPVDERQNIINRFQDPKDKLRFFLGNQATGGYGITLTAASTVIYYSNTFDLEKRIQSEDRAHRIGQTNKVTYIDIMTEKTIDEKIVKALRNKINIASEVMGEKAREWLI